ncbi:MAG: type 4a pilus biogenesis protein PilO, partial [Patescibacteria group bacterium]
KKLLPDHIDNVRLIIDIDSIASRYGLGIKNIKVNNESDASSGGKLGPNNSPFGTFAMKFNIVASYDSFRSFINDLQESLRIVDISNVSFEATESGYYDYEVTIKTYWIK